MTLPAEARLQRFIDTGDLGGVFFLYGDAARLRDEAAGRLAEAALDPTVRDFNLDRFRGSEVEPEALAGALATPPVLASRRVVLLQDAEDLTPTGAAVLLDALDALPDDVTFIVTATIPARSKKKLWGRLKKGARTLEWSAPGEAEIPGWLIERARRAHGFELGTEAAQALAGAVGADLGVLDAELEKLAAVEGEVTRDTVAALVPNVRPVDRWSWLDGVASRRYAEALRALPDLLAEPRESAVGLLAALIDQHLYVGIGRAGGAAAVSRALSAAGKPYLKWKARTYAGQARRWSDGEIERALRVLLQADMRAKSGVGDDAVLEELLLALRVLAAGRAA